MFSNVGDIYWCFPMPETFTMELQLCSHCRRPTSVKRTMGKQGAASAAVRWEKLQQRLNGKPSWPDGEVCRHSPQVLTLVLILLTLVLMILIGTIHPQALLGRGALVRTKPRQTSWRGSPPSFFKPQAPIPHSAQSRPQEQIWAQSPATTQALVWASTRKDCSWRKSQVENALLTRFRVHLNQKVRALPHHQSRKYSVQLQHSNQQRTQGRMFIRGNEKELDHLNPGI